jgi:monovalent cation:H+ antiporter, CPA1 family
MNEFILRETVIIELLLVVSVVAIVVRRLRLPYTVALVIVGLFLAIEEPIPLQITPQLILALLVPPLVFEAAFRLDLSQLLRNLPLILVLAIPGVVMTTLMVGAVVAFGAPLTIPVALVFGALISATDPVSVVSMFRSLGVDRRLAIVVEGESLLNDGTAIVAFNLALAMAISGRLEPSAALFDFVTVAAGGTMVGLGLGWVTDRLISRIDDYLIETTLTVILAFGAYLVAESLHVSGVLAVVAAGLVCGNYGPQGMSPTTRIVLDNFWDYVAFLANSMVFLLIGLQIHVTSLVAEWQAVAWAITAVLAARVVVVYGLGWLSGRLTETMPLSWLHVLNWSGLRGAICLALALSLPDTLGPQREMLQVMTFGVVLFSLMVQGTTMSSLLRRLHIGIRSPTQIEYEMRRARFTAVRAAEGHLDHLHRQGVVSAHTWEALKPKLSKEAGSLAEAVRDVQIQDPTLEAAELDATRRELLRARRGAYVDLRQGGQISEEVMERLLAEVDAQLTGHDAGLPEDTAVATDLDRGVTPVENE